MLTRSRSVVAGSDGHDEIATSVVSGSIKPPMLENPEDWPTFKYQWRKYEESVTPASASSLGQEFRFEWNLV